MEMGILVDDFVCWKVNLTILVEARDSLLGLTRMMKILEVRNGY